MNTHQSAHSARRATQPAEPTTDEPNPQNATQEEPAVNERTDAPIVWREAVT